MTSNAWSHGTCGEGDVHLAPHAGIDDDVQGADLGKHSEHGPQVRVLEVHRHGVAGVGPGDAGGLAGKPGGRGGSAAPGGDGERRPLSAAPGGDGERRAGTGADGERRAGTGADGERRAGTGADGERRPGSAAPGADGGPPVRARADAGRVVDPGLGRRRRPRKHHPQRRRSGFPGLEAIRRGARQLENHPRQPDGLPVDPHAVDGLDADARGGGLGREAREIHHQPGPKVVDPADRARRQPAVPPDRDGDRVGPHRGLDRHDRRRRRHRRRTLAPRRRRGRAQQQPPDRPSRSSPHRALSPSRSRLPTTRAATESAACGVAPSSSHPIAQAALPLIARSPRREAACPPPVPRPSRPRAGSRPAAATRSPKPLFPSPRAPPVAKPLAHHPVRDRVGRVPQEQHLLGGDSLHGAVMQAFPRPRYPGPPVGPL